MNHHFMSAKPTVNHSSFVISVVDSNFTANVRRKKVSLIEANKKPICENFVGKNKNRKQFRVQKRLLNKVIVCKSFQ